MGSSWDVVITTKKYGKAVTGLHHINAMIENRKEHIKEIVKYIGFVEEYDHSHSSYLSYIGLRFDVKKSLDEMYSKIGELQTEIDEQLIRKGKVEAEILRLKNQIEREIVGPKN